MPDLSTLMENEGKILKSAEKFIEFTTKIFDTEVTFKNMRDDTDPSGDVWWITSVK